MTSTMERLDAHRGQVQTPAGAVSYTDTGGRQNQRIMTSLRARDLLAIEPNRPPRSAATGTPTPGAAD